MEEAAEVAARSRSDAPGDTACGDLQRWLERLCEGSGRWEVEGNLLL